MANLFDEFAEDAAQALRRITPYTIEETRAIVQAIATYRPVAEIAPLLTYAGVRLHGEPPTPWRIADTIIAIERPK